MYKNTNGALLNKYDPRDITLDMLVSAPLAQRQKNITDISNIDIFDQGYLPICVGCAELTAYKYNKGNSTDLSKRAIYAVSRMYSGLLPSTFGAMPRDAAKATVKFGIPTVNTVPDNMDVPHSIYSTVDITEPVIDEAIKNQNTGYVFCKIDQIRQAIDEYGVCTATILCDVDVWVRTGTDGRIGSPKNMASGWHRIVIFGYETTPFGDTLLHIRNSWGNNWGNNGNGTLSVAGYHGLIMDIIVYTDIPDNVVAQARKIGQRPMVNLPLDIKYGETGQAVRTLQKVLAYEGLINATAIDGSYGPKTAKAVQEFQLRYAVATLTTIMAPLTGGKSVGQKTRAVINKLYGSKFTSDTMEWAKAIQSHEGYFSPGQNRLYPNGTLSWKNNNPGNIKFTNFTQKTYGAIRADSKGFCVFRDYSHGFNALCQFLVDCASGKLRAYWGNMTLVQFFSVYAPSADNNNPVHYANTVARAIGVNPSTSIRMLV